MLECSTFSRDTDAVKHSRCTGTVNTSVSTWERFSTSSYQSSCFDVATLFFGPSLKLYINTEFVQVVAELRLGTLIQKSFNWQQSFSLNKLSYHHSSCRENKCWNSWNVNFKDKLKKKLVGVVVPDGLDSVCNVPRVVKTARWTHFFCLMQ